MLIHMPYKEIYFLIETSKDHDSYDVVDLKAGAVAPSRRKTQTGTDKMQQLEKTSRHVQGSSQEQIIGLGKQQGSGGQTDLDSEEGTMVRSGRATQSTSVQIQGERVDADKSTETSWESAEVNNGKLAVVHNSEGKNSCPVMCEALKSFQKKKKGEHFKDV